MNLDWLPGLDLASGTFTVPLWVVGVVAALLVALVVIAVIRSGLNELGSLVFRAAVIVIAVVLGWSFIRGSAERDKAEERRALDQRSAELVSRATVPGSAIACLEATNTETVEGACERAVFASPETVAAATAYIAGRLTLLADAHEYTARRDQGYESSIAGLRRTIAADRYGLASQVLATRDGCTADACDAFGLVYDDKKLRANMRDRLFDATVGRYAVNWPTRTRPLASSTPAGGVATPPALNATFPPMQPNTEPPQTAAPSTPPAQAAAPTPEPRPTNSAPASAARRPPAAAKKQDGSAPLSLNPAPKQ